MDSLPIVEVEDLLIVAVEDLTVVLAAVAC